MASLSDFTVGLLAAGLLGVLTALPAQAQSTNPASPPAPSSVGAAASGVKPQAAVPARTQAGATAKAAEETDTGDADSDEPESSSSGAYAIHAALKSFDSEPRIGDSVFVHASESFPSFCKDWQRRLHDRELNNLENISWKDEKGWKTGTYVAYSPVKTCSCKRSTGGVPIGELTYQETEYYLAGRTVEEARHAQPKPVGVTNTTEIFRWDKTKWDDGR